MTEDSYEYSPDDLSEDNLLRLFAQISKNTREVTESHRPAFFDKFQRYAVDLNRISRHIDGSGSEGFRKAYFHVAALESPLRAYLNYDLQNRALEYFGQNDLGTSNSVALEAIRDAITSLDVLVISDVDGRETIDIPELQRQLTEHFEGNAISEDLADSLLNPVSSAVVHCYDDFVQTHSDELINYYQDIERKCSEGIERTDNKWNPVLKTTSDQMIKMDRQAISWRRGAETEVN